MPGLATAERPLGQHDCVSAATGRIRRATFPIVQNRHLLCAPSLQQPTAPRLGRKHKHPNHARCRGTYWPQTKGTSRRERPARQGAGRSRAHIGRPYVGASRRSSSGDVYHAPGQFDHQTAVIGDRFADRDRACVDFGAPLRASQSATTPDAMSRMVPGLPQDRHLGPGSVQPAEDARDAGSTLSTSSGHDPTSDADDLTAFSVCLGAPSYRRLRARIRFALRVCFKRRRPRRAICVSFSCSCLREQCSRVRD